MCSSLVDWNGTWGETISEGAQGMCSSSPVDGNGERPFLRKFRGCAPPLQSMGMGHGETFSEEVQGTCSSSPVDGNGTWGMTFSEGCSIEVAYSVSWEVPPLYSAINF